MDDIAVDPETFSRRVNCYIIIPPEKDSPRIWKNPGTVLLLQN
jgi:hypothetical protein